MYGTEVSPDFISTVTDAVMAEVTAWQSRPLEPMYPVVFFDALRVKIRDDAVVRNKAVYLALGVLPDGTRDILGIWIEQTEGAKFWMKVFNDLKTRGVQRHPDRGHRRAEGHARGARGASIRATTLQTCIVHLIRNSLDYASWKDRKVLAAALRPIYTAPTRGGGGRGPGRVRGRRLGQEVPDRRRRVAAGLGAGDPVLCLSAGGAAGDLHHQRASRACNARLRKIIKTRGHFPTDEAATKLIWLALAQHHRRLGQGSQFRLIVTLARSICSTCAAWLRGAPVSSSTGNHHRSRERSARAGVLFDWHDPTRARVPDQEQHGRHAGAGAGGQRRSMSKRTSRWRSSSIRQLRFTRIRQSRIGRKLGRADEESSPVLLEYDARLKGTLEMLEIAQSRSEAA